MRSSSSGRWLREHFDDGYVKQARERGFRSRAVFKLKEIDERDRLFRRGMVVVDLGAAPGGWSQYVAKAVGEEGRVVALDRLPMEAIPGVRFVLGDFHEASVTQALTAELGGRAVDWVLSDMAPNLSGTRAVDQPRAMYLAELAFDTACMLLTPGGGFLVKLFQGSGFEEFQRQTKRVFARVAVRKPSASRDRSREVYLLAQGFKR